MPNSASRPLLALCIPAYKRPALLEICLRSVIRSAAGRPVPIVISDDSTDDTNRAVVERLTKEYPHIEWHRNPRNLGIDRNILQAVSLCRADYAWLLGEDDLLTPGAVSHVLSALERIRPAFLFVNYSYVSNDYRYYLQQRVLELPGEQDIPAATFVERYAWAMGFIGACVVQRKDWVAREDFVGTYYAHVGSILSATVGGRVLMLGEPLVLNRAENTQSFTWSSRAFDVFFGWERMLRHLQATQPFFDLELALKSSSVLFRHRSIAWLISKRADGLYDLSAYREFIRPASGSTVRSVLGWGVAICPRFLCRLAKYMGRDLPRRLRRRPVPFPLPTSAPS